MKKILFTILLLLPFLVEGQICNNPQPGVVGQMHMNRIWKFTQCEPYPGCPHPLYDVVEYQVTGAVSIQTFTQPFPHSVVVLDNCQAIVAQGCGNQISLDVDLQPGTYQVYIGCAGPVALALAVNYAPSNTAPTDAPNPCTAPQRYRRFKWDLK